MTDREPGINAPPDNEELRSQVIAELGLRHSGRFDSCDDIVGLLQLASRRPVAIFTVMDRSRQWFHAHRGIEHKNYVREESLCAFVVGAGYTDEPFVVGDTTADGRFLNSPLVTNADNIRFYAALPVKIEGVIIGVVAIADHKPGKLSAAMREALRQARRALENALRTEAAAYIDRNSGLHNRRYFDAQMLREWRRAHRRLVSLTIAIIEIDHLQEIRQQDLPAVERKVVQTIAEAIQTALQRPADIIARYDDSRIVAVLPETGLEGTTHVIREIIQSVKLSTAQLPDTAAESVQVNIGAAIVMADDRRGATHHNILRAAEGALEEAKIKGPGETCVREL